MLVRSFGSGETPGPGGGASLADDRYETSCERHQIWLVTEGAMRRTKRSSLHERDEVVCVVLCGLGDRLGCRQGGIGQHLAF